MIPTRFALTVVGLVMLVMPMSGVAAEQPASPPKTAATEPVPATDNMTPYRTLANDALAAIKDTKWDIALEKFKEIETKWDVEKELRAADKKNWKVVDLAMDGALKAIATKKADTANAAIATFVDKLSLTAKKP